MVTVNLNKIIDRNYYPVPEAKKSNLRHRPIGLGVQGLADAFIMVRRHYRACVRVILDLCSRSPELRATAWLAVRCDSRTSQTRHGSSTATFLRPSTLRR